MPTTYPFDPTGTQTSNRIIGEQHIITPVNYKDYSFVVPRLAPLFATNLIITFKDQDNNTVTLVEGVDWYLSHWFISASRACSKPIYGSISFLNRTLNGVVTLNYNTIGGDWTIDEHLIAQIMADRVHNPRETSWDSVAELPYSFPVIDHEWDLVDMVGMSEVVDELNNIRNAILATTEGGIEQHILDYNNPHRLNAAHVNLGLVRNLGTATSLQAIDPINDGVYMTPWSTNVAVNKKFADSDFEAHIQNQNNPHATTAEQLNAYTKDVVDALLLEKLNTTGKALDTLKFDGMTKQQWIDSLSIGSVENANKFNNMTYPEVVDDILSQTIADSNMLEGKTYDELKDEWENITAKDSDKISGRTIAQFKDEVGIEFMPAIAGAKLANQYQFPPNNLIVGETNTHIWAKIATIYINETFDVEYRYAAGEFLLSGGLGSSDKDTSLLHVRVSTIGSEDFILKLSATILTDGLLPNKVELGYTFEPFDTSGDAVGNFVIWCKTTVTRRDITVTELTKNNINFNYVIDEPLKVEPVGIAYLTEYNSYVNKNTFDDLVDSLTQAFISLNTP